MLLDSPRFVDGAVFIDGSDLFYLHGDGTRTALPIRAARLLPAPGGSVLVTEPRRWNGSPSPVRDARWALDRLRARDLLPDSVVLLGHSMGGCLLLLALASGERRFAADTARGTRDEDGLAVEAQGGQLHARSLARPSGPS